MKAGLRGEVEVIVWAKAQSRGAEWWGEQPHLEDIEEALSENEVPRMFRMSTPLSVEGTEMAVKTDREAMEVFCTVSPQPVGAIS